MRPIQMLLLLLIPAKAVLASDDSHAPDAHAEARHAARAQQPPVAAAAPSKLVFIPPAAGQERYRLVERDASGADPAAIEIHGDAGQTLTPIVQVDQPPVKSHVYVVRGRVKYEDVAGTAYLEMWNDFGARGAYFTRTLADAGPMRSLSGTSDWRDVELPFTAEPGMTPSRLTINVVMPGPGTIALSPLTVEPLEASSAAWWSPPQGGLVGGIGGTVLGLLGAAIGVLTAQRRAKGVVLALIATGLAGGLCLLTVGATALCLRQPFFVAFPLLLLGGIATIVMGLNAPTVLRRYREEEFRKIAALDA